MFILKKFIVAAILPPFGPLLLILAGLWMMRRWPRFGRTLTFGALFLLMLMSLPLVEIRLQRLAETSPPLPYLPQQTLQALAGAQAIVVLGGGTYPAAAEYGGDTVSRNTLLRIRYAARLQRKRRVLRQTAETIWHWADCSGHRSRAYGACRRPVSASGFDCYRGANGVCQRFTVIDREPAARQ